MSPTAATLEREKDKLFVTDEELIRRLGMPERTARKAFEELDADPKSGFPPKQPMWGNRRYWRAVEAWMAYQEEARAAKERAELAKDDERPSPVEKIGDVYFLASPTHVKIGFSAAGVKKRARQIRQNHFEKLELLGVIDSAPKCLEGALHKKFAAFRANPRREWFKRVREIEEFVRDHHMGHWRKELLP